MKKKIQNRINIPEEENKILDFWEKNQIFDKQRKKLANKKKWSFIDGPITANNKMGVHHGWGRSYKDLYQRYMAMKGFNQRWQNGFDGQGLWVEVEVEKDLGLNSKKEIEKFGIDKFSRACRKRVEKYSQIITDQSKRLGQWMDWDSSYQTMSDENIESIWFFLKKCQEKKMLYQGHTSLPWCVRCGTSLSSHELHDNYKELTHKAVYLKYPLKNREEKLLVWTTTPWTLLANVSIAVDPKMNYLIIESGNDKLIVAENRAKDILDDYKQIKKIKGKELIGQEYKGAFDELEAVETNHKIITWDEVGDDEGTGLVHIAPGCGQEDFDLAKENDLAITQPIDEAGKYLKGFGEYTGKSIKEIEKKVFEDLKNKGYLLKTEDYKHRYPLCWRCDDQLAFRAVKEWFIKADPVREKMKQESDKVDWVPADSGKRMTNWLENMADWNISRKRYWGLPLPFYPCQCGELTIIGSKKELKEQAVDSKKVDDLPELHRPWIDEIKIKCPSCGKDVSRVSEVGDCWLDAGIVPFSTLKYTSDKKYWQSWFPAEFVVEMREQVRLWFYSMLFMSVVLEKKTPYKSVLTYSEVADEKGEEMHKSKGNAIWFDDAVEKIGADNMRWIYLSQNPIYQLKFGYEKAKEIDRKFNTWWNSLYFLVTYANLDNWQVPDKEPKLEKTLDKWMISRLEKLNQVVEEAVDKLKPNKAVDEFDHFLDDLSNWYIRRSRKRFWKSDQDEDKKIAYYVLYQAMLKSAQIMAPFFPFFTENVFQILKTDKMPESVHLTDYPKVNKNNLADELTTQMNQVRETVEKGLALRAKAGIKVRQPLNKLTVKREFPAELQKIISDEVNVKQVEKGTDIELDTEITDELKEEGMARELVRSIQQMRKKADFELSDRITVYYQTDSDSLKDVLDNQSEYIAGEVLADGGLIEEDQEGDLAKEKEIEKEKIKIAIKKK